VVALQHAGHVVPIELDYELGEELGGGTWGVGFGVRQGTNDHFAVKIIDKTTIAKADKDSLRNEIAILKLVHHPNIVHMEGVFESRRHIHIVMEKVHGGELFSKIVGRPRFKEPEFKRILRPLLDAVAYLHDLGIVHRDIKPENILCGDEWEDIKVADFGLSKMVMPKEKMEAACGTPSYLAPEVGMVDE
jgi:calcium/calmodulin-dependent protein kinase I